MESDSRRSRAERAHLGVTGRESDGTTDIVRSGWIARELGDSGRTHLGELRFGGSS